MYFHRAIVRTPSQSIAKGLTSSAELGVVDYSNACQQHHNYVDALKCCGLEVTTLGALDDFPDACFVEDPAVLTPEFALCTRPGAPSRMDEVAFIEPLLAELYPQNLHHIQSPGFLDGGDVLQIERHFYIGLSARTNLAGAEQLIAILKQYDYQASIVSFENMLHLKTGVSYIANQTLLIQHHLVDCPTFNEFHKIIVEPEESYAANSIMINDKMLMPAGFPRTIKAVEQAGYAVIPVDLSEFRKIDGGLSCLSLRF
ncbi:dimethylarginine dimethylaminohydrolase family protein [Legionella sp. W05-934-2]|jgi:dimethylargininase|uniref:dimethylarginine dimethylaminohydrolase family protein n=1 Tax=Legionella sp. W05-934-2 TaxID=1198649 RepID=UPI003463760B